MKSIAAQWELRKPAQCLAVDRSQSLVAVACSSEMRLLRINYLPNSATNRNRNPLAEFKELGSFAEMRSTISDVAWSKAGAVRVALSYANGHIICLNVDVDDSREVRSAQPTLYTEWNSGRISSAVNRICWHPTESNVLASANQDGIVRIFDFRYHQVACQVSSFNQRSFVSTKDVQFDPFHEHIFAEVLDNGCMKIWDRRVNERPLLTKLKAHNGSITSVAWCPCWEWVLATGSKDKTIKLWDVSLCNGAADDALASISQSADANIVPVSETLLLGGSANSINLGGYSSIASNHVKNPMHQLDGSSPYTSSIQKPSKIDVNNSTNTASMGSTLCDSTTRPVSSVVARSPRAALSAADIAPEGGVRSRSGSGSSAMSIEPVIINTIHAPSEVARMGWSDYYFDPNSVSDDTNISNEEILKVGATIKPMSTHSKLDFKEVTRKVDNREGGRNDEHGHEQDGSPLEKDSVFPLLATASTGVGSSAEAIGHIYAWDAMNTNIPINVMSAHSNEMCADFNWIMRQLPNPTKSTNELFEAPKSNQKFQHMQKARQKLPSASESTQPSKSRRGSKALNRRGSATKSPPLPEVRYKMSFFGVISVSRDGKLILQNMKMSYFPHEHIARNVTAISSQGHVAYQTAVVPSLSVTTGIKYSSFHNFKLLLSNFYAVHSKHLHQQPIPTLTASASAVSGASKKSKLLSLKSNLAGTEDLHECKDKACMSRKAGIVSVGMEIFQTLQETQRIRSYRGAEAGITDPALIAILARKYRIDPLINDTFDGSLLAVADVRCLSDEQRLKWLHQAEQMHEYALNICKRNSEFARSAGLTCRVSVWTTLQTLLPKPRLPEDAEEEVSLNSGLFPLPLGYSSASETKLDQLVEAADSNIGRRSRNTSHSNLTNAVLMANNRRKHDKNIANLFLLTRNSSNELPFAASILAKMISELLEGGDAQHFVMCCEVLRTANVLKDVCAVPDVDLSPARVRQGYLVYLDLLSKLQLFCEGNDIIKASRDPQVSQLSQMGVTIEVRCGRCGKDVLNNRSTGWCQRCTRCVTVCALCQQPISGLYDWCPLCAHGGHLRCMQRWFQIYRECPAGCGHLCCSSKVLEHSAPLSNHQLVGCTQRVEAAAPSSALQKMQYCVATSSRVRQRQILRIRRKELLTKSTTRTTSIETFYDSSFK